MNEPFIHRFKELSKKDVSSAGGKGASLGEMTKAGIPVPEGFVILADTFEKFLREEELHTEIDAILHKVDHKAMHTVERASEEIKALILGAKIPPEIATAVQKEFGKLKAKYVAVRSSATAEDSSSAAWAGQLESYLNTTRETVLENVKKCWASLFTPRAIFYRFEQGLHEQHISVAVVVQKMVESEVSGIAFSVHPVTQDKNQLIIEAGYGLGEAIVSGQITPDSYVVEKKNLEIVERTIHEQKKGLYRSVEGGNGWREIAEGGKQKLSDKEIRKLAQLVVKIEEHYGFPVDVEWALEGRKFFIVQSRPITTLKEEEREVDANSGTITKRNSPPEILPKELYHLSFKAKGLSVLMTDINKNMFQDLNPLLMIHHGTYYQFFPQEKYWYAQEEGVNLFGNTAEFKKFEESLQEAQGELKRMYSKISKNDLTRSLLERFLRLCATFCTLYGKMNTEYTDKAYTLQDKDKILKQNLARVTKRKDEVRSFLNRALFEKEGYLLDVLGRLSMKFSIAIPDLERYTEQELLNLFKGKKLSTKKIEERKLAFVIISKNGTSKHFQGKDAEDIAKQFQDQIKDTTAIKGQCANLGKVTGKVRIIPVDYSDFESMNKAMEKMEQGEILVAETTAPELMKACKKAGAIVTDLGGMLSHAAIVSRELSIPCLVGTKISTKVLKDGDLVEVDANKGVVKKLK